MLQSFNTTKNIYSNNWVPSYVNNNATSLKNQYGVKIHTWCFIFLLSGMPAGEPKTRLKTLS